MAEAELLGFNPLKLELNSSSRNIEKEHPSLVLVGEDYRSFGTGKVRYMSEFYDGECYFILITEKYLIKGILVAFYFKNEEERDDDIDWVIKMVEDFDGNDKVKKIEKRSYKVNRIIYLHKNYFYAIHLYEEETFLDWSIIITKNDIGMLDA